MTKKNPNLSTVTDHICALDRRTGKLEEALNDPKSGLIARIASIESELKMHRWYIPLIITIILLVLKLFFHV